MSAVLGVTGSPEHLFNIIMIRYNSLQYDVEISNVRSNADKQPASSTIVLV